MSRHRGRNRWLATLGSAAFLATSVVATSAQPPLEALPSILQLQLSQHPAWRAYKDAAAEGQADAAHSAAQAALLNAMTTPQRLEALRAQLQAQQRGFDRQAEATEAFYAVLSPDQRRSFDEVTRLPTQPSPMRMGRVTGFQSPHVLRTPPQGAGLPAPAPAGPANAQPAPATAASSSGD